MTRGTRSGSGDSAGGGDVAALLKQLFDVHGLRRWVFEVLGKQAADELPEPIALAELAFRTAAMIERRGGLDDALVDALIAERPRWAERIRAVAAASRAALAASPDSHAGRDAHVSARLTVRCNGAIAAAGTAWLAGPDLVVTTFQTVGDLATRTWWHEREGDARYVLEADPAPGWRDIGDGAGQPGVHRERTEIALHPLAHDAATDLALLRAERPVALRVLRVARSHPAPRARWRGQGFVWVGDERLALAGVIDELRGDDVRYALRLAVDMAPRVTWSGVSGTPVCADDSGEVFGVITNMTDDTATGWGIGAGAIRALLRRDILSPDTWSGPSQTVKPRAAIRPWLARARQVAQALADDRYLGVALLEPLGFGARRVVSEVVTQLRRPGARLLPIRLVPDRRSTHERHLYRQLLRDLRAGLAQVRGLELSDAWWDSWSDRMTASRGAGEPEGPGDEFEDAVSALVAGPLAGYPRTLLFVVDGLASMPLDHAARWGYLMKRLCDRGIKLVSWGGHELKLLITAPRHGDQSSAFHHLAAIELAVFDDADIEDAVAQAGLARERTAELAREVQRITGGHPALVHELCQHPGALARAVAKELAALLFGGTHMERLTCEVRRDAALLRTVCELGRYDTDYMPHDPLIPHETRVKWLGMIAAARDGGWTWTAPLMQRLARSLAQTPAPDRARLASDITADIAGAAQEPAEEPR